MTGSNVLGGPSEQLLAVGASHRTAPLALLGRLALSGSAGARILAEVASHDAIHEAVALSTCNRTDLYLVVSDHEEAERTALAAMSRQAGFPRARWGCSRGGVSTRRATSSAWLPGSSPWSSARRRSRDR
jgi:hypothetical protein